MPVSYLVYGTLGMVGIAVLIFLVNKLKKKRD